MTLAVKGEGGRYEGEKNLAQEVRQMRDFRTLGYVVADSEKKLYEILRDTLKF